MSIRWRNHELTDREVFFLRFGATVVFWEDSHAVGIRIARKTDDGYELMEIRFTPKKKGDQDNV